MEYIIAIKRIILYLNFFPLLTNLPKTGTFDNVQDKNGSPR